MKTIENMSVLVTGGGSGLGEGVARFYGERGARITICGRRADKINAVANDIGEHCQAITADITDDKDRQRLVSATVEHGGKLDLLVSNAGNMYRGNVDTLEQEALLDIFNTNVVAGMMLSGLTKPHLAKTQGAIIFISSVHTRRAFPGASPYAATKGALETLTKVLAAELGEHNIRVNCVVPGAVLTEIYQRAGILTVDESAARLDAMAGSHALGRIGTSNEIAEAIDYLARAEWTTGAILDVDGGLGLGLTDH
ncbi:MAG: 3-oxoacyl-[acyl-carrier protein] reductase [Candidatus Azotimanducaceae bacterium]